jgi:hypothetical protein
MYGIKQLETEKRVKKVDDLLYEEAFHFGLKANSVSSQ